MSQDQYPSPDRSWPSVQQPDPTAPQPPPTAPQAWGQPLPYGSTGAHQEPYGSTQQAQPTYLGQPGYGGGQWAAPPRRPGTTTAGAVMAIIGGAFAVLTGILLAGIGDQLEEFGPIMSGIGIVVLVVGAVVLTLAVLALRGTFWAVIALAVIAGLWLIAALASLFQGQGEVAGGLVWIAISMALLLSPQSRAWYRARS